ncbi:MAG: LysM peptidoglycan-binding domain-containing protein [Desulfosarcina sp.]|nr:LysM peptidoglycan-binding domain-containing protein [Desulfobacterales bacterium]
MIKIQLVILLNIIVVIFCGCSKNLHKSSDLKYNNHIPHENNIKAASLSIDSDSLEAQSYPESRSLAGSGDYKEPTSKSYLKEFFTTGSDINISENTQRSLDEALDYCQVSQDFWQKGEFEDAIESLDQAYSLILNIDTDENPKLIQQKDDLRFMISKRILEIYASQNIVVNGNHNEIPIVLNKHVQKEIKHFTKTRERKFFIESYKRSGKYRPYILAELKKAGLPLELSWLPLIESGFKVKAFSKARALGLWQFIPSTGYKFGLKRNIYIDERMDPDKATKAAIQYLKQLHQIFGDWATVLAAYNCGEGRVLRVIRSQNVNYLDNFWDLYERLPRETARYVPRFLATLHIIKNKEQYGLDSVKTDNPLKSETIIVSKKMHLKSIAKAIAIPEAKLRELNPELRYKVLPDDKYPLKIPAGKSEILLSRIDNIPIASIPRKAFVYHRIRPGDSLSTIAKRYHTSIGRIARANNIYKKSVIRAGKVLKIPQKGTVIPKRKRYRTQKYGKSVKYYVKRGDSLWIIAGKYGISTKEIRSLNNLNSSKLHIGQTLMIPERKKNESIDKKKLGQYLVKRGDSPYSIAQEHNLPLERFLRLNNLEPRNKIYPGQHLAIE